MAAQTIKRGSMQIKRNDFSPEIVKALETVPAEKLAEFLGIRPAKKESSNPETSKWAKVVKEIEALNISEETSDFIRKSSKEFREEF